MNSTGTDAGSPTMTEAETASQRKWRLVREHQEAKARERELAVKKPRKARRTHPHWQSGPGGGMPRDPDGYDRDDLGLSPDF